MEINRLITLIDQKSRESECTQLDYLLYLRKSLVESSPKALTGLDMLLPSYFFRGIAEDFASHQWIETSKIFKMSFFTGGVEALQQKIAYYLKVCTSADQLTRDSFAELIQYGNAAEIKPLIYDELKGLEDQLCSFNPMNATNTQILDIKKTLKEIVKLTERYHA